MGWFSSSIRLSDKNVSAKGYKVLNSDLKLGEKDFNIKNFS